LGGGKPAFSLDDRRGDGKISAIRVIDDNRQSRRISAGVRSAQRPWVSPTKRCHCAHYLFS
jgi:hypothetical protein